jgi:hypothetical protein
MDLSRKKPGWNETKENILANQGEFFTELNKFRRRTKESRYIKTRRTAIATSELAEYAFHSEQDIRNLVSRLVPLGKDSYIYPVTFVYDPKAMVRLGLWPTSFDTTESWFIEYLEGLNIETLRFWNPGMGSFSLESMPDELRWQYRTLSSWRQEASDTANSIPLKLYAPELLYPSLRPVNDMYTFRSPNSYLIDRADVQAGKISIEGEAYNVIPVTRYAKGMSRGMFHEDVEGEEFCGTFYYSEPTSNTLLGYKSSMTFFNKTTALQNLDPDHSLNVNREIGDHISGQLPLDLIMTPFQAIRRLNIKIIRLDPRISQEPHYAGMFLDMYAKEDIFDQAICQAAHRRNIDLVIFEYMVGSFQVVTEVLDTRSRPESFDKLIYIVD